MEIEIRDVTYENLDDLMGPGCAPRWEDPRYAQTLKEGGLKKKQWVRKALQRFGYCAKIAYFRGKPVGFIKFYPMQAFPLLPKRRKRTVLITCVLVSYKALQNHGIGSQLVQSLIKDLKHKPLPYFEDKPGRDSRRLLGLPQWLPRISTSLQKILTEKRIQRICNFPRPYRKR
jgi:GNAT superfamily N-acetyltransferase